MKRSWYPRFLRRGLTLGCFVLLSCQGASNSTRTGSESHFSCEDDADCPDGRCENDYCVFEQESSGSEVASDATHTETVTESPDTTGTLNTEVTDDTSDTNDSFDTDNGVDTDVATDMLSTEDASNTTDTPSNDAPDAAATSSPDNGAEAPNVFRIVNQTEVTVYVDAIRPLTGEAEASGSEFAMAPFSCLVECGEYAQGGDCCIQCEQEWPRMIAIEAGASYDVSWDGTQFVRDAEYCSLCQCQARQPTAQGSYAARVTAYAAYGCGFELCGMSPDGTIGGAIGSGANLDFRSTFVVPAESDVVVIAITTAPEDGGKQYGQDCELNSECASGYCYSGEPMNGTLPQKVCEDCLTEFIYPSWCDEDADCCDGLRCGAGELAGLCVQ